MMMRWRRLADAALRRHARAASAISTASASILARLVAPRFRVLGASFMPEAADIFTLYRITLDEGRITSRPRTTGDEYVAGTSRCGDALFRQNFTRRLWSTIYRERSARAISDVGARFALAGDSSGVTP